MLHCNSISNSNCLHSDFLFSTSKKAEAQKKADIDFLSELPKDILFPVFYLSENSSSLRIVCRKFKLLLEDDLYFRFPLQSLYEKMGQEFVARSKSFLATCELRSKSSLTFHQKLRAIFANQRSEIEKHQGDQAEEGKSKSEVRALEETYPQHLCFCHREIEQFVTNEEYLESTNRVKLIDQQISKCSDEGPESFESKKTISVSRYSKPSVTLTRISAEIAVFKNLFLLEISYNHLTCLPDSLEKLENLLYLYAFNNDIVHISDKIGNLTKIKRIYLSHNKIEQIPHSLGKCITLEELKFSNNHIRILPNSLVRLRSLQVFNIEENPIDKQLLPQELDNHEVIRKAIWNNHRINSK